LRKRPDKRERRIEKKEEESLVENEKEASSYIEKGTILKEKGRSRAKGGTQRKGNNFVGSRREGRRGNPKSREEEKSLKQVTPSERTEKRKELC